MLSYLKVVQKLVEPEIYQHGLKLYLEGKVLGYQELILDYWRRYEVQGRTSVYWVDIPLLHLALDRSKYDQAAAALSQVVRSTSPYFAEYGIDSQIVAVCAALDQEFQLAQNQLSSPTKKIPRDVWHKILEVENSKKEKEWLATVDEVVHNGFAEHTKQFANLKEMISSKLKDNQALTTKLTKIFANVVGDYLLEKNLVKLFTYPFFLSQGSLTWWRLIQPFFTQLDKDNQVKLVVELWKNYLAGNTQEIESELLNYLRQLPEDVKNQALEALQTVFVNQPGHWLKFPLQSGNLAWLQQNLDQLDSHYLILAVKNFPEYQESIEQKLCQQVRIWSNFLQPGDYAELLEVLKLWQANLGASDYLAEILDYIRANHPKKSKLLRELDKLS